MYRHYWALPNAQVALDISAEALEVAQTNVKNNVTISAVEANMLNFESNPFWCGHFEPPYVTTKEQAQMKEMCWFMSPTCFVANESLLFFIRHKK